MWLLVIVYVVVFISIAYLYGTRNYDYWKKKGVKGDKPVPFFGNELPVYLQKTSLALHYASLYNRYPKEKVVGFYRSFERCLLIRDPEIIKRILITDFHYFHMRGIVPFESKYEPMFWNLFSADGDIWKLLRVRMTPAFSSGKLKAMFPLIVDRAEKMQVLVEELAQDGATIEIRDVIARFATDFIGACGFGIEADALNDENSAFRKIGKRMFEVTLRDAVLGMCKLTFPQIFRNVKYVAPEIENGIQHIMREVMKARNYKASNRNDFIDMLLELKEKGTMVGNSIEHRNADGTPKEVKMELNEAVMAAQVYIFFAAGFETSSSSSSFTLHQLAFHPEEQAKVQEEIDRVLAKYDNKLCYEAVKEMKYLEMAFNESMRILSPVGYILRKSAQTYVIPGTDVTIDPGVGVYIPTHALHNDEQYFADPDEFRPERFSSENLKTLEKCVYLPFGEGQRACIGARLGLMQALAGMAAILQNFTVEPAATSLKKPKMSPGLHVVQKVEGGLPLRLIRRK